MRLFQPCSLAIRHNLFVPPPTKDILWLRATIPAPTIPIENRKHMNCFLSLCVFSWFSPPSSYSFNLVFFIFNGSFSKFFLSLAWMRIAKPVGLTFSCFITFGDNSALTKRRLLRFAWQVFILLAVKIFVSVDYFTIPFLFLSCVRGLFCGGEFFGRIFEQRFQ